MIPPEHERPAKTTSFNVSDIYQSLPLEDLKEIADERRLPYAVALANITGDLNTGIIIRTACVFGAHEVFMFGKRKYDRRSTVGAHHYIHIHHHESASEDTPFDWEVALQTIRVNGYTPVLIEQGGQPLSEFDPRRVPGRPCLVFGSEESGIPPEICDLEYCYTIPQPGILRSLNVSTAAGIAMYHTMQELFLRRH